MFRDCQIDATMLAVTFNKNHRKSLILGIDTTQAIINLAIVREGEIIASKNEVVEGQHSKNLFALLGKALHEADVRIEEVDRIAVNTGPGGFTGVRVGIASVSGLGRAINKPIIGVNSIDAHAYGLYDQDSIIVVLLQASRNEVFCGIRYVSANGIIHSLGSDMVGSLSHMLSYIKSKLNGARLKIVGDAALKNYGQISLYLANSEIIRENLSTAGVIALYVLENASNQNSQLTPYYIRPSEAEIKRQNAK